MGRHDRKAYPDLNQGPADLQSAALTTELYTHVDRVEMLGYFPLLAVILWFFDLGSKSGPPFRDSSESVLGTSGLVSSVSQGCPWRRTPIQQRAWRPWKPLCHCLQPKCWMARLALTLHALPWTRASASVSPCRATCACFYARRPSRRRSAGQDAPWEARTPALEVNSLTL